MKQYRYIGKNRVFKIGEMLELVDNELNNTFSSLYSNGTKQEFLYTDKSPEVEYVPDFVLGSKWVAKCNITARTSGTFYISVYEGEVLELTSIWDTRILEFNHRYVLEKDEARLLLSPFTDTPKKMTLEEIETELGYKVRLVE